MTSIDLEIVENLRDHFELGTVDSFRSSRNPVQELFAWNARGPAAIEVLKRTTPHVVGQFREHAEAILEREFERPSKTYSSWEECLEPKLA